MGNVLERIFFLADVHLRKIWRDRQTMRSNFVALVFIVLGTLFLLSNFGMIPHVGPLFRQWWPLILIMAGGYMLMNRGGK